jgi:hypothetical protein
MFLDLDNLTIEQLLQKQIEIRQRMQQARMMSGGVMNQLQGMLEQVTIQLQTRIALDQAATAKEKAIADGKDPQDDSLIIG